VEIWMTRDGVTSPTASSDFIQTGGDGLGTPAIFKSLWSAISTSQGADYYIYVSAGNGIAPVAIFRQKND
jgi:hypothetical protein